MAYNHLTTSLLYIIANDCVSYQDCFNIFIVGYVTVIFVLKKLSGEQLCSNVLLFSVFVKYWNRCLHVQKHFSVLTRYKAFVF